MSGQKPTEPFSTPGVASAENGHVVLDGPDGVAITMTPRAAAETGKSLIAAAEEAKRSGTAGAEHSGD
jgi:hypothetical protein